MLLCAITCGAQQYVFSTLDTSNGLSDNFVFHVMQLQDGRIVVTTSNSIDLWNGKDFQHIRKDSLSSTQLWQPMHFLFVYIFTAPSENPSGLWHHTHLRGHPFMKMVVLMPGPSLMANRLMSKMSAMLFL